MVDIHGRMDGDVPMRMLVLVMVLVLVLVLVLGGERKNIASEGRRGVAAKYIGPTAASHGCMSRDRLWSWPLSLLSKFWPSRVSEGAPPICQHGGYGCLYPRPRPMHTARKGTTG